MDSKPMHSMDMVWVQQLRLGMGGSAAVVPSGTCITPVLSQASRFGVPSTLPRFQPMQRHLPLNLTPSPPLLCAIYSQNTQGSGWGWLGYNKATGRLEISTMPNQDPLAITVRAPCDCRTQPACKDVHP